MNLSVHRGRGEFCRLDLESDYRIVVVVDESGRLIEARPFCDDCIKSGHAFFVLGIRKDGIRSVIPRTDRSLAEVVTQAVAEAIEDAMFVSGGRMIEAARILKINRATLYRHLHRRGEINSSDGINSVQTEASR